MLSRDGHWSGNVARAIFWMIVVHRMMYFQMDETGLDCEMLDVAIILFPFTIALTTRSACCTVRLSSD